MCIRDSSLSLSQVSAIKWPALRKGALEPCKVFPHNVTQAIARPQSSGGSIILACLVPCAFDNINYKNKVQLFNSLPCQRPYHVEHTSSRPITEVKQHWARIVLRWETAWELRVPLASF